MLIRLQKILFCLLGLGFAVALCRFAQLRFSSGEAYPQYSTLRADPFGAKALFEGLKRVKGTDLQRYFDDPETIKPGKETAIFFLGTPVSMFQSELKKIEALAREGGRVIVAFNAEKMARAESKPEAKKEQATANETNTFHGTWVSLSPIDALKHGAVPLEATLVDEQTTELPPLLPWNGHAGLKIEGEPWTTIYEVRHKPVVVEKKLGLGRIILAADSFPFSNEAMLKERSTAFLVWTMGGAKQIVFDESHLGLVAGNGLAVILRQYRLQGLLAGFLLVAGLWIWKNSSSLVPVYTTQASADSSNSVAGKTNREGILHLLERNIPPDQVPKLCLEEWEKSHRSSDPGRNARLQEKARQAIEAFQRSPGKDRDALATYLEIMKILSPKTHEHRS